MPDDLRNCWQYNQLFQDLNFILTSNKQNLNGLALHKGYIYAQEYFKTTPLKHTIIMNVNVALGIRLPYDLYPLQQSLF